MPDSTKLCCITIFKCESGKLKDPHFQYTRAPACHDAFYAESFSNRFGVEFVIAFDRVAVVQLLIHVVRSALLARINLGIPPVAGKVVVNGSC